MARASRGRPAETTRPDWLVAALAAAALLVAGYLAATKLAGGSALFCSAGSGCDVVQASRYAVFLGLPTALWGAGLYAAIGGLALARLTVGRWLAAFLLAVAAASFSLYLTYLELFVLRAVCAYCVLSAALALALVAVLLARRPRVSRRSVAPRRVAGLGVATAVATVVFGAGVFAVDTSPASVQLREGLARHLAETGSVMYGAYW